MTTEHIQIGDVSPRIQYEADGSQTAFTYPFPIFMTEDLEVYVDDEVQEAGYEVAGVGASDGGAVTFDDAPADGAIVTLRRRLSIERVSDFQESGSFRAKVLNDELDYQTAAIQQVAEDVGRALRLSVTDANADLELPVKAARAGRVLAFDGDGDAVASSQTLVEIQSGAASAATSAAAAATSATAAATSASIASGSATAAAAAEAAAEAARAAAETAQTAAEAAADEAEGFISGAGLLVGANNLSDVANAATAFANIKQAATETASGAVELATSAEVIAGTDTSRAVTPAGFATGTSAAIAAATIDGDQLDGVIDGGTY